MRHLVALALFSSSGLLAANIGLPPAACVADTLAAYIALGATGCSQAAKVEVVTFDVGFVASATAPLTAADITVTPQTAFSAARLSFTADFQANTDETLSYLIFYTVDPPPVIHGWDLEMFTLTPADGARATVTTELCLGTAFLSPGTSNACGGILVNLNTFFDSETGIFSLLDKAAFDPQFTVGVRTTVLLEGETGFSDIDGFANGVLMPEPSTSLAVGCGLLAALLLRSRRR